MWRDDVETVAYWQRHGDGEVDEVNLEEADEGAILERMIAWRQQCGSLEERAAAWRTGAWKQRERGG
ncbi:hypothetical protein FCV25MIE_20934 [Fagus crenata]